jgi:hypothetical protein
MSAQDVKFFQLVSITAAASVGVSVTVGAVVVAAVTILPRLF